jgi:hypothetical protein
MKTGRPSKQTPEVIALIAASIAKCHTDTEAALIADIDPLTLIEWKKDPLFNKEIQKAVALRIGERVARIEKGDVGWQGTAWLLERLHKDRFAKPELAFAQQINVNTASKEIQLNPVQLQVLSEAYDAEKARKELRVARAGQDSRTKNDFLRVH